MTEYEQKTLAEILAFRDGEPYDPEVVHGLSDAQRDELVAHVTTLRGELTALEDVPVDHQVWRQKLNQGINSAGTTESETDQSGGGWMRFPLATAASVFLASAIGIFILFDSSAPQPDQSFSVQGSNLSTAGTQVAGLMSRSRELEQRLNGLDGWVAANSSSPTATNSETAQASPAEGVLLYRLADVDGQIARLYEQSEVDETQRLALWNKRVDLLENLVVMRGAHNGLRSIYLDNGRSM